MTEDTMAAGLPGELPGYMPVYSGKVRELFAPIAPETGLVDESRLLLVASDRISAFDHVIETPIPDKGAVLTQLSLWWFERLADLVPNHVVDLPVPEPVSGRAIHVRRLQMLPVECIARAYLTGSGLADYQQTGSVCGVELPAGLVDGSRLPEPIFTPTTKAPLGQHDEPMRFEDVEDELGSALARRVRDLTVAILARGNEIAADRGILIADTKVEYGVDPVALGLAPGDEVDWTTVDPDEVEVVLADEVLTPDSSRFWRASEWEPGHPQTSYDKQVLRDWLLSPASGWDRASGAAPPRLPADVVHLTRARYVEAYESLTGQPFIPRPTAQQ
jgi:phosphoribosylaminoimidazole-succinocarboxamide synthase